MDSHAGRAKRSDPRVLTRVRQPLDVEFGVICVVIAGIQIFLHIPQGVAETLEMDDFTLAQELDRVAHVRVIDQAQQVVVSCARFLLWCRAPGTTQIIPASHPGDLAASAPHRDRIL